MIGMLFKGISTKFLVMKSFFYLILISSFSPVMAASVMTQKAYAASILGANLCFLRKGELNKKEFVLNVENLMLRRGYDIDYLYNSKVRRAGKLIANKIGKNCSNQKYFKNKKFLSEITEILM